MTLRTLAPAAATALALTLAVPRVHADVLVDNLLQPTRGTTLVSSALWAAQSFVTAADTVSLLDVQVVLGLRDGDPAITAGFHADAGGAGPGALLANFGLPALSAGAPQIETLLPSANLALAPASTYWVVLGVDGSGSFGWSYAEGNAVAGPGSLGNYAYSTDGGAAWGALNSDNPYRIRVNVAPIPEPASVLLIVLGLAGIAMARRRTEAV